VLATATAAAAAAAANGGGGTGAVISRRSFSDKPLTGACAFLLGGEGPGLPEAIIASADGIITIPMEPPVESLNVAVSAGLIIYEARRQRLS
jgi:tRNA G18 (ribose-2'-O)-methylase SpoU